MIGQLFIDAAAHEFNESLLYRDSGRCGSAKGMRRLSHRVEGRVRKPDRKHLALGPEQYDNPLQIDWNVASPRRPDWLRRWHAKFGDPPPRTGRGGGPRHRVPVLSPSLEYPFVRALAIAEATRMGPPDAASMMAVDCGA